MIPRLFIDAVFSRLLGLNPCESHFEFGWYIILPWRMSLLNAAYVTLQGFFWSPPLDLNSKRRQCLAALLADRRGLQSLYLRP